MVPIAKEFDVSVTAVAAVLTIALWLRLVGAIGSDQLPSLIGVPLQALFIGET